MDEYQNKTRLNEGGLGKKGKSKESKRILDRQNIFGEKTHHVG